MCIIVVKEKGVSIPSDDILENCFNNNSDGCGFAYCYKNKVHLEKGILNVEGLKAQLLKLESLTGEKDLKNIPMIIHFRIGTSGGINKEKTHPFIISNKYKLLNKIKCDNLDMVMCHNGILSNFTYNKELSDTQNFIRDVIFPLYKHDKEFYKKDYINNLLYRIIGDNNKLAFLTSDGTITLINKKAFIKDNGVYYSNSTYKKSYSYYTNYNYNYYSNKYYNDDYIYDDDDYDYNYDDYDTYYTSKNDKYKSKSQVQLLKTNDVVENTKTHELLEILKDNVYCIDDKTNTLYKLNKPHNTFISSYDVEKVTGTYQIIKE